MLARRGGYAPAQALLVPLYGDAGAAGSRRVAKQVHELKRSPTAICVTASRTPRAGAEYMRRVILNIARSLVFPLLRGAKQRPDVLARCGCRFLFGAEQRRAHTLRGMGTVQRCGCRSPFRFAAGQWDPTSHAARGGDHESVGSGSEKTLGCAVEDRMHWSVLSPSGSSARAGASSTPIPGCERICRPHVLGFLSLFAFLCGPTYSARALRAVRDASRLGMEDVAPLPESDSEFGSENCDLGERPCVVQGSPRDCLRNPRSRIHPGTRGSREFSGSEPAWPRAELPAENRQGLGVLRPWALGDHCRLWPKPGLLVILSLSL
ncbi:hypothetical protein B0H14DRAFT_2569428 [Mycena olivaceomarginata]|nr:hypothetical protein B0H14DRAFT_2569428 [Mycena olivaceomarginata]